MTVAQLRRPAGATRLVLRCLGRFRLEAADGEALQLRTRKARAVLACLAVTGRPMSRDVLAALLWSERAPAQARSSVRQAVFELQHLKASDTPVLAAGREDVAVRPELVVTDLALIRAAAMEGDWSRLAVLLQDSETGFLSDLEGLDDEFDSWLRTERAQQPSRTLETVVAAAERCRAEAGPRTALDLLTQVVRLDPLNEEAARTALGLAHELGDQAALHRHFHLLRDRLREDLDAEPSAETVALFKRLGNGGAADLVEERVGRARSTVAPAPSTASAADPPPVKRSQPVPMLALVLVLALAALAALALNPRGSPAPGVEPVLVAVLPFEQQPKGDGFIASGLWEHTRAALTRSGAMRVLGRATTASMAEQRIAPAEYRRRFGVTHLLEGTVRRTGEQVHVSVSLSQTRDGLAVWHAMFTGRMSEPLALQDSIATGIEGRLRGRLAEGGGRRAEQIATTPEVHGLYSEARVLMNTRRPENQARAKALLRRAVAADPNYAPAWSLLGAATLFSGRRAIADAQLRAEAAAAVRRALELAPNLAQAHATLAMVEGDGSPAAERALRRAVALDPGYAEAWNWLGNALNKQHRQPEAIRAYQRAIAIDPLLQPAIRNLSATATESGEEAIVDQLMRDLARAGAGRTLVAGVQADRHYLRGDYSESFKVLAAHGLDVGGRSPPALWSNWFDTLVGLGEFDRLKAKTDCPQWYAPLLRGEVMPPRSFEGKPVSPEEFWTSLFFSHPASRAMIGLGQSAELVRLYRAGFRNPDEFISEISERGLFESLAPTLAVALKSEGAHEEASYILASAANRLEPSVRRSGNRWVRAELALVRAAQAERGEALALLESAVRDGWLPDGRQRALDLAREPALSSLRGDPRFEAIRKRVLAHIARERAELGPVKA